MSHLSIPLFLLGLNVDSYELPNGTLPLVLADFQNGVYRVGGVIASVTDMFEPNLNWGDFDINDIIHDVGYKPMTLDGAPALKSTALSTALTEGTVLIEFELPNGPGDTPAMFSMHDATFALEYTLTHGADYKITDNSVAITLDADGNLAQGVHKVSVNVRNGAFAGSLDGAAVQVQSSAAPWTPAPTEWWLLAVSQVCILRKVAIYPTQPDADLPMLSTL